jgi:hypothetical protein
MTRGPRWSIAPFWNEPPSFCIVCRNGVNIMLAQFEVTGVMRPNRVADPEGGAWDAYISIDNADGLHAEFTSKGVKIGYRLCFGQDLGE